MDGVSNMLSFKSKDAFAKDMSGGDRNAWKRKYQSSVNLFSSTLSGISLSYTFVNKNSLLANVCSASLHLDLLINPSLLRSNSL